MEQELLDEVAITALNHYNNNLPSKGKPKENEWTVFAAIVVEELDSNSNDCCVDGYIPPPLILPTRKLWVVSCATGTKCCTIPRINNGCDTDEGGLHVLRDSHAEVLARRGLVRVLWNEIKTLLRRKTSSTDSELGRGSLLMETVPNKGEPASGSFALRHGLQFHMYVSDSPCGDASIYDITSEPLDVINEASVVMVTQKFTGSKIIVREQCERILNDQGNDPKLTDSRSSAIGFVQLMREPDAQNTGLLRTKSGRSNLASHQRSVSMSCSDKIVRWSILGLEGSLLSQYMTEPVRLTSIVVGRDPLTAVTASSKQTHGTQENALHRAIPNRVQSVRQYFMNVLPEKSDASSSFLKKMAEEIAIPTVGISNHVFQRGKAMAEHAMTFKRGSANQSFLKKRKREETDAASNVDAKPLPVIGISINWQACMESCDNVELTVGARGIRQGKKPKCKSDEVSLQSRLCRHQFWKWSQECGGWRTQHRGKSKKLENTECLLPETYALCKLNQCSETYRTARAQIFSQGSPLAGWLVGDQCGPVTVVTPTEASSGSDSALPSE